MRIPEFDPAKQLAVAACPRCHAVGLKEISDEVFRATTATDTYQGEGTLDPSVSARCGSCGLVMEWPACTFN